MMGTRQLLDSHALHQLPHIVELTLAGRLLDALNLISARIDDEPYHCELYVQRANILFKLRRMTAAELDCRHALALDEHHAKAWVTLGCIMIGRFDRRAALKAFERAAQLAPQSIGLRGAILTQQHYLGCPPSTPQWRVACQGLETELTQGHNAIAAFGSLFCLDSPLAQLQAAQLEVRHVNQRPAAVLPAQLSTTRRRIRVGYVSPHFHTHPLLMLLAGMFECHDRSRFEVFAIATDHAPARDAYRRRVLRSVEHLLDFSDVPEDTRLTEQLRALELDVVFDLDGHTRGGRPVVFSNRVAPVQISWLGHIGTTGMPSMDYVIADPIALPVHTRQWFTEQVIDMPVCYQANDSWRRISVWTPSRRGCELPRKTFVFCCHNQVYKITPPMFDAWMQILQATGNSVLWLYESDEQTRGNLRLRAQNAGVDPQRLVFAGTMPYARYLARYRHADLFLDTHPYNAGATCSDALWSGLPVLTLAGHTFASRMGASLLHAVGLPELVVHTQQAYVERAIALANDPRKLQAMRKHLRNSRHRNALYGSALQTRWLESAITQVVQRQRQGQAPCAFSVSRSASAEPPGLAWSARLSGRSRQGWVPVRLRIRGWINRAMLGAGDWMFALVNRRG